VSQQFSLDCPAAWSVLQSFEESLIHGVQQSVLVDLVAGQDCSHLTAAEHRNPLTEVAVFLEFAGVEQDDAAATGQGANDLVDLQFGAEVDAPGRVIEQNDRRLYLQPLAQNNLLLITAGQAAGGITQ
jgi:hypothetical protein